MHFSFQTFFLILIRIVILIILISLSLSHRVIMSELQRKIFIFLCSDNKHKLVQTMHPDAEFMTKEQEEFDRLEDKLRANLSQQDK